MCNTSVWGNSDHIGSVLIVTVTRVPMSPPLVTTGHCWTLPVNWYPQLAPSQMSISSWFATFFCGSPIIISRGPPNKQNYKTIFMFHISMLSNPDCFITLQVPMSRWPVQWPAGQCGHQSVRSELGQISTVSVLSSHETKWCRVQSSAGDLAMKWLDDTSIF